MSASAGGIVAGKAFVLIEAIDKTGTMLAKVGKRFKDWGDSLSSVGRGLMTKGLLAAAPIGLAVNAFRNFQAVMSDLQKTSGATDAKMQGVGKSLNDISKATGTGPTDLARGLQDLVAQGMDLDQAVASMQTVAQVSKATGSEITDVTKTAFQLQSALNIDPSQLGAAFDILASAGKQGAFELKDIATHLPTIASQAASLGVTGVDGAASLAAMLQVVRKGAPDAATAANNLSNMMAKVISPETIKSFKAAGVNIEEIVKGAQSRGENPLEAVLDTVQKITGGDTFKVGQIFKDMQARNAIVPLLKFRKEYDAIRDSSKGSVGIIDADAAASAGTLNGILQSLWASLERIGITVGQTLWPAISQVGNAVRRYLTIAEEWLSNNQSVVFAITGIVAGVVLFGASLTVLGGIISVAGIALTGLAALISPGGLILAGIAAGVVAIPAWGDAFQAVGEKAKEVLDVVGQLLAEGEIAEIGKLAMEGVSASFDWVMGTIKANWDIWLQSLADKLYEVIGQVWGWWSNKVSQMTEKLLGTKSQDELNAQEKQEAVKRRDFLKGQVGQRENILAARDSGKGFAGYTDKDFAIVEADLARMREELAAAESRVEWLTGTGLGGKANDPIDSAAATAKADTSVADRERQREQQQSAADAAKSKLGDILQRGRQKAIDARNLRQTNQYADDFASAMGAGFAVPGGAISPASLPGMPGGAGAGMVDSGIRVTANEAIERGSMAAAKLDSEQYVRDLAGEQLSALEQIARNTDPANQVGDDGEGV